tara:strand:- start:8956 stop:10236 length:1281 start_codon:yes stop_codon:yes gene_type:complete
MQSDVRQWLAESKHRGMELGVRRVFSAHQELIQSPYSSTIIHIAGSNGKGTLCATLAAHLNCLEHSTVMFTSPHLIEIEERVRIDGQPLDACTFDQFLSEIRDVETSLQISLTFFEITFLVGCLCAYRNNVDYFIVETGLGGRYDATRILAADVSVLTSLSLEHRDILGNTLAEIAAEKAAIARPDKPLLVRHVDDEGAVLAIEQEAVVAGRTELGELRQPAHIEWVYVDNTVAFDEEARLLAEAIFDSLGLETETLGQTMMALNWPGRFHEVSTPWNGSILFDAAHNPSGLAKVIPQINDIIRTKQRWTLVFGCTPQHDLVAFSNPLVDLCSQHPPQSVVLTKPQHGRYPAVRLDDLETLNWPSASKVFQRENAKDSAALLKQSEPEYCLVIGSLYLVGEMYESMGFSGSSVMDLFPANTQRDEA